MIGHLVQRSARRWPNHTAIVDERGALSFRQLSDRVCRLANGLLGLGLEPGDRVLDVQRNSCTAVETDLACAIAGLVRVPVDPSLSDREIAYIGTDSGATAVVVGVEFHELSELLRDELRSLRQVVAVDGAARGPQVQDYEELIHAASASSPVRMGSSSSLTNINYSSGTTGPPKGCMCTARGRVASAYAVLTSITGVLGPDDVFLHAGPLVHASSIFVLPYLTSGSTQVLLREFDVERLIDTVRDHGVTGTALATPLLEQLADAVAPSKAHHAGLASLRHVAYTGAPIAPDRIAYCDDVLAQRLVQFYGSVEALAPLSVLTPEDHREPSRLASAGLPVLGVAVRVIADDGREVSAGEPGELLVGGDHVMRGYWSNRETTSLRKGWVRTGDIASVDEHGYLYLLDRLEDRVISGGFNVMPREVEDVLEQHPGVGASSVVGVLDREWGEVVVAFVVAIDDASGLERDLRQLCQNRLPSYKAPRRYEFVKELPTSVAGKVSRKALRARATQDDARVSSRPARGGPVPL